MTYQVRLREFEGPLELLLHLIEKEKLDITRVSLSKVADQYLDYLRGEENITLGHLAEFLSIAARLILLKSRALLPLLTFTDEEEESIEDLENKLREYQHFRQAAMVLGKLFRQGRVVFPRERSFVSTVVFHPPKHLTVTDLTEAFGRVLGEIPVYEPLEKESLGEIITLEQKILHLQESLSERMETSFRALTEHVENRVEVIVAFLALLELVKQRFVVVDQGEHFSDIKISRISSSI